MPTVEEQELLTNIQDLQLKLMKVREEKVRLGRTFRRRLPQGAATAVSPESQSKKVMLVSIPRQNLAMPSNGAAQ